jgi:Flp pilus assembly protein TadD
MKPVITLKAARLVLLAPVMILAAGCQKPEPVALANEYLSLAIQGQYARQYSLLLPSIRRMETRQDFVDYQEGRAARKVLKKAELVSQPPKGNLWRAIFKLTWETGGRPEVEARGLSLVQRDGRWWVADSPASRAEANEAYVAGDAGRATRMLQRIVRLNPTDAEALDLLGYVLRDNSTLKNNLELAVEVHRRAVELEPNNPDWHLSLGNDYRMIGWYSGAVAEIRKSASLSARGSTYVWLGVALAAGNQVASARDAWRKALSLDPDNAQAHAYLEKTR